MLKSLQLCNRFETKRLFQQIVVFTIDIYHSNKDQRESKKRKESKKGKKKFNKCLHVSKVSESSSVQQPYKRLMGYLTNRCSSGDFIMQSGIKHQSKAAVGSSPENTAAS